MNNKETWFTKTTQQIKTFSNQISAMEYRQKLNALCIPNIIGRTI